MRYSVADINKLAEIFETTLRKIFIISAIIPATFSLYLCIVGFILIISDIFRNFQWSDFLLIVICLLAICGYVGLWKSLFVKSNEKKLFPTTLLIAGILSLCLTMILVLTRQLPLRIFDFPQDIGRLITTFWPAFVSLILVWKKRDLYQ